MQKDPRKKTSGEKIKCKDDVIFYLFSALKAYPRERKPLRCRENIWTKDAGFVGISKTFPRNTKECFELKPV